MILFVDDEAREMDSFLEELKLSGHDVEFCSDVDQALCTLQERAGEVNLLILDIMMPPGSLGLADTESGFRTGLHLFDRARDISPDLPIIVFSNVTDDKVIQLFRKKEKCRIFKKESLFPHELEHQVRGMLEACDAKG